MPLFWKYKIKKLFISNICGISFKNDHKIYRRKYINLINLNFEGSESYSLKEYVIRNPNSLYICEEFEDELKNEISDNGLCSYLFELPHLIKIIKKFKNIDFSILSKNSAAIDIIKNNLAEVSYINLCENPNAIDIIEENFEVILFIYKNTSYLRNFKKKTFRKIIKKS